MLAKQAEVLGVGLDNATAVTVGTADNGGVGNANASNIKLSAEQTAYKAELRQLQAKISRNNSFLTSLYESLKLNDITKDEYREMRADYQAKIADLMAKENELRHKMVERLAIETATANAVSHLQGVRQIADLTADSLDKLIDKILVFKDRHIEVQFKFMDGMNLIGGERVG